MISVSCANKFHAFALSEQLDRHQYLDAFYTTFAYQKNTWARNLISRQDKEKIDVNKIRTNLILAGLHKSLPDKVLVNSWFDSYVSGKIAHSSSKVFIGWSGMSLQSIRMARKAGLIPIVERGSSHICFQDQILREEHAKFGIDFKIDERVIATELAEYQEADYISIPSGFVKQSFLQYGVPESKLIVNPYGASEWFQLTAAPKTNKKFRVVYLGGLSVRKGLIYLFEALNHLNIAENEYEVEFIGGIDDALKPEIEKCKRDNWKFRGHIPHYDLPAYLQGCDVAIQPSLEEGLSMVIPQLLACGIPVIGSENSGAADIITPGYNGFVVPVRNPGSIAFHIQQLFDDSTLLAKLKNNAAASIADGFTWQDYGNRYVDFLSMICNNIRSYAA